MTGRSANLSVSLYDCLQTDTLPVNFDIYKLRCSSLPDDCQGHTVSLTHHVFLLVLLFYIPSTGNKIHHTIMQFQLFQLDLYIFLGLMNQYSIVNASIL